LTFVAAFAEMLIIVSWVMYELFACVVAAEVRGQPESV